MRWGLNATFGAFGTLVILGCLVAGVLILRHREELARLSAGRPQ
jgi:hypothetical protein